MPESYLEAYPRTLADGISRYPRVAFGSKLRELTNSNDWSKREIGELGVDVFNVILRTKHILNRHDELMWNLMESGTDRE